MTVSFANSQQAIQRLLALSLCFVVLLLTGTITRANPPRQVSYILEPINVEKGVRMRIELSFTGHESGRTELVLPARALLR